jgi:hypothetical protein
VVHAEAATYEASSSTWPSKPDVVSGCVAKLGQQGTEMDKMSTSTPYPLETLTCFVLLCKIAKEIANEIAQWCSRVQFFGDAAVPGPYTWTLAPHSPLLPNVPPLA